MTTLFVATRKGLFVFGVSGHQAEISGRHFLGDPVSSFTVDAAGHWYAALNLGHFGPKLHCSKDEGVSWQEVSCPALPKKPDDSEEKSDWKVKQVWVLEADAKIPGKLLAGTIPGALFQTNDGAESWQLNETLWAVPERTKWFGGGFDESGVHSIAIHPSDANKWTVAISVGGVWHSEDAGASWQLKCAGMRAEYMPEDMQDNDDLQDPHRLVQSPTEPDKMWVQHHCGIFHSVDGGKQWQECHPEGLSSFGFAVVVHPKKADTAWFVPAIKDESRYPENGEFKVSKTVDGGQTFEAQTNGLPQQDSYDLIYRHALDIDESGDILVMGSTTGNLWITDDGGERWHSLNQYLPPIHAVKLLG